MENIGVRLKLAREGIGYTLEQVDEKTGISKSSLSDYEKSKREPKFSQLSKLAHIYKKPIDFFFSEEPILPKIMLWREVPQLPSARMETEAEFERLCQQYHRLEVVNQEVSRFDFGIKIEPDEYFHYDQAKNLANEIRKKFGLGDIPSASLKQTLEEKYNVKIFYDTFHGSAISTVSPVFGAGTYLNKSNKHWRRSFDLAHELFHLLTWDYYRKDQDQHTPSDLEERLADCFASTLLLPQEPLEKKIMDYQDDEKNITLGSLEDIAREFDVSFEALMWRIKSIYRTEKDKIEEIISKGKSVLEKRKERPNSEPDKYPKRYWALAIRALGEGNLSLMQFAKYTDLTYKKAKAYLTEGDFKDEEISISVA